MGPRHNSNMKAFKQYSTNQNNVKVKQSQTYGLTQLNKFIFKFAHENQYYFPIRMSQYRLFTGNNPSNNNDDIKFDSDFECGNLDLAIYINSLQYDLVMRIDSNTKGHTSWFYFKVSNIKQNKKIKFNIINFNKKYLSYKDGMKPYVFKKNFKQWTQDGISVAYCGRKIRYQQCGDIQYKCLSFTYQFKNNQQVYFAYCVPYSYSYLLHRLELLRNKAPHLIKISSSQSSGGLPIPVLTITNFSIQSSNKVNILCTGRLHPGESQGSWVIDGFMTQLISSQLQNLLDRIIFKIIPMVNVDGVVLGNFRTGIMGRDLNRCFNLKDTYNQITMIRRLVEEINPLMFIDFHGHSSKKNVFIYGPEHRVSDHNYIICRIFPKLISKQTEVFRYYSCSFHISKIKVNTGRAILLKQFKVPYSYTVEASAFSYGPVRNLTCFTSTQYIKVGKKILTSLIQFTKILISMSKIIQKRLKNKKQSNTQQQQSNSSTLQFQFLQLLPLAHQNIINQVIQQQHILNQASHQFNDQDNQYHQDYSQSDCQDATNDYTDQQIHKILQRKHNPFIKKAQLIKEQEKKNKVSKKKNILQKSMNRNSRFEAQKSLQRYKNTLQLTPQKTILPRNRSYTKKLPQLSQSNSIINVETTIQISKYQNNLDTKTTKIIQNHSSIIDRIIKNRQKKRLLSDFKDIHINQQFFRKGSAGFDWSTHKIQHQSSSKHFKFQLPNSAENFAAAKRKQSFQISQIVQKTNKKTIHIMTLKKSLLPSLGKVQLSRQISEKDKQKQKSALQQILYQHEKKKKQRKDFSILFH